MSKTNLQLCQNIDHYFEKKLQQIAEEQSLQINHLTLKYLSKMLNTFISAQNFLQKNPKENKKEIPTLAIAFLEAQHLDTFQALLNFQKLGDTSLFISGFLPGHIERSLVDQDYYSAIGGGAYRQAAYLREKVINSEKKLINIFFELSDRFNDLVPILAEISYESLTSDSEILSLYQKWLDKQSESIERYLKKKGIILKNPKTQN